MGYEVMGNDYDEACMRIQAAARTLATRYALPESARGLLRAIAADAGFAYQFGLDADPQANDDHADS